MRAKRPLARQCENIVKQYLEQPDEPAAPDGGSEYAEWVQIAVILLRVEINKSLRETEAYLNDMTPLRDEFDNSPDQTTICRWEQKFDMRGVHSLLRRSAEQAGWTGVGTIGTRGFQRDQTSYHYGNGANYSFQAMKTTILADVETLAIKDVHFTTRKSYDGHIRMQAFGRNAEGLHLLLADKGYS